MPDASDEMQRLLARLTALEAENESLRLHTRALEASNEGITLSDCRLPDHPLVYVNAGFEALTGYTREEVVGRNCRFLQGEGTDPETLALLRAAIRAGRPCTVELLNQRKDGTPFWNRLALTPLHDGEGRLTHFVGIQSDITRRMQAEGEVRDALELLEATNRQLTRANRRMKYNLDAAARVQQTLLPEETPEIPGFRCAWEFRPSDELAGDILNVFALDAHCIGMYVLDVSGHGTAAALLAVSASHFLTPGGRGSSFLRSAGEQRITPPAEVADRLNRQFPWDPDRGQFLTLVYGVLCTKTRQFRYVTAGHPGPLLLREDGQVERPRMGSFPIGLARAPYTESTLTLAPGDRLFLYSDGLTDVFNLEGDMFGTDRLVECLRGRPGDGLEMVIQGLFSTLETWNGGRRFKDDLSILGVELPGAR